MNPATVIGQLQIWEESKRGRRCALLLFSLFLGILNPSICVCVFEMTNLVIKKKTGSHTIFIVVAFFGYLK